MLEKLVKNKSELEEFYRLSGKLWGTLGTRKYYVNFVKRSKCQCVFIWLEFRIIFPLKLAIQELFPDSTGNRWVWEQLEIMFDNVVKNRNSYIICTEKCTKYRNVGYLKLLTFPFLVARIISGIHAKKLKYSNEG